MLFQFTPPRGRRQINVPELPEVVDISIHASAREATVWDYWKRASQSKFQFTPPRGRRLYILCSKRALQSYFNSRLREGGDGDIRGDLEHDPISIHASAREATSCRSFWIIQNQYFNSRLREGGDQRSASLCTGMGTDFNSRLREGGDS